MSGLERVIQTHGRTFALASRLLPRARRGDTVVLYAWYRRADDAVDRVPPEAQPEAAGRVGQEVDLVYGGAKLEDPLLLELRQVVLEHGIPRVYFDEFVAGLLTDARAEPLISHADLMRYCYRVAGTVGAVMAHVLGASEPEALRRAAHMGMAMQLTNICRDVEEDFQAGRVYLPESLTGGLPRPGRCLPSWSRPIVARAVSVLLDEAEALYRSGDRGLSALAWRTAFAIRAARLMYAEIGAQIRRRGYDVLAGRAVVPTWRKLVLLGAAFVMNLSGRSSPRRPVFELTAPQLRYPEDVLPV